MFNHSYQLNEKIQLCVRCTTALNLYLPIKFLTFFTEKRVFETFTMVGFFYPFTQKTNNAQWPSCVKCLGVCYFHFLLGLGRVPSV